jgi:hypothetical protein
MQRYIVSSVFLFGGSMQNRHKDGDIEFIIFFGVISVFAMIWVIWAVLG